MTTGSLVQWFDSSEAVLGLIIAVAGGAASGWFSWHQRNMARRERAADLFDRFYSPEQYHVMVAPVFVITLRWYALRGAARAAYATTLCMGWAGRERAERLVEVYAGADPGGEASSDVDHFEDDHFRRARSTDEITEHAALTAFLYFWVKLQAMLDANLVCKRLTRKLFRQPYAIYAQFIADFRQAVTDDLQGADPRPAWLDATRELETFLLGEALTPEPLTGPDTMGGERGIRPSET